MREICSHCGDDWSMIMKVHVAGAFAGAKTSRILGSLTFTLILNRRPDLLVQDPAGLGVGEMGVLGDISRVIVEEAGGGMNHDPIRDLGADDDIGI